MIPDLNWAQWVLISLYVFSMIWTVAMIGKPQEPRTPERAVVGLVLSGIMIWLVVIAGQ